MELLTKAGWSAAQDIEFILIQIRANMLEGNARLNLDSKEEYTEAEALKSFRRVAESYGWEEKVPKEQKK